MIKAEKLIESTEKAVLTLITWALNELFLIEAFEFLAEIINFWIKIVIEAEKLTELTENELFLFFLLFLVFFLFFVFFLSHRLFNLALAFLFNTDDNKITDDDDDDETASEDDASDDDDDDEITTDDDDEILRA